MTLTQIPFDLAGGVAYALMCQDRCVFILNHAEACRAYQTDKVPHVHWSLLTDAERDAIHAAIADRNAIDQAVKDAA